MQRYVSKHFSKFEKERARKICRLYAMCTSAAALSRRKEITLDLRLLLCLRGLSWDRCDYASAEYPPMMISRLGLTNNKICEAREVHRTSSIKNYSSVVQFLQEKELNGLASKMHPPPGAGKSELYLLASSSSSHHPPSHLGLPGLLFVFILKGVSVYHEHACQHCRSRNYSNGSIVRCSEWRVITILLDFFL